MQSKTPGRRRSVLATLVAGVMLAAGSAGWAEEPPTREQVEQLQKQLADMQKEMDAMQQALRESEGRGTTNPAMHQHMMGMQQHWRMMHDQACMMAPGTCPQMGMPPPRP